MSIEPRGVQLGAIILLGIGTLLVWLPQIVHRPHRPLMVAFLDVGQGDAIFIETPNRNQILIDGGPDSNVLRELPNVMPFWDRSIDLVISTHPDQDHIGGLIPVLEHYHVKAHMDPGVTHDTGFYEEEYNILIEKGIQIITARSGMQIILDEGVTLDILSPQNYLPYAPSNTSSVVTKLTYGRASFLFTSDIPVEIENILADGYGEGLDVDILQLPHHGSRTSTGERLLELATPSLAIISAGRGNRYGHPHEDVLARLGKFAIPYLGTYNEGSIVFESNGVEVVRK